MANGRKRAVTGDGASSNIETTGSLESPLAFEDAMRALEDRVTKLDAGQLPLDEALALYEEGVRLVQRCQTLLDSAQLRIERLRFASVDAQDEASMTFSVETFQLDGDR